MLDPSLAMDQCECVASRSVPTCQLSKFTPKNVKRHQTTPKV